MVAMAATKIIINLKGAVTPDPVRPWVVDLIADAALAVAGDRILWLGRRADLPADYGGAPVVDGQQRWASPGVGLRLSGGRHLTMLQM